MVDKDMIKAALDAVSETQFGAMGCPSKTECCCPGVVIYFIFTNCVTINNGACPDWAFCTTDDCGYTAKSAQVKDALHNGPGSQTILSLVPGRTFENGAFDNKEGPTLIWP